MYIERTRTYYQGTEQCAARALFLMLIYPKDEPYYPDNHLPIKAIVRKVALRQCGHWMMGTARVYGHSLTVSGSYGHDGLIMDVPREVYDRAQVVLPDELYELWAHGGGWNSAGSEALAMCQWALENLEELVR